jgi:hypothetical protein
MISRFFKKKTPKAPAKAAPKKKVAEPKETPRAKMKQTPKKILTAEGWKRLMMKKYGAPKKK